MVLLIKQWKLTDLIVKIIVSTDDSVKRQITDLISENLTDSDLESSRSLPNFIGIKMLKSYSLAIPDE